MTESSALAAAWIATRHKAGFCPPMTGQCRSVRSDYESARTELESKMEDLDSRLRSVQDSCGYEFTLNRMSSSEAAQQRMAAAQQRLCASYKRLVGLA
jgi:hypothetical protein